MKWLELSSEKFEPMSDIQVSLKKPLFAASVVLSYSRSASDHSNGGPLRARAEVRAKIPIKGELHYSVEVIARAETRGSMGVEAQGSDLFAFAKIWERDESGGSGRTIESLETSYMITKVGAGATSSEPEIIDVINDSPSRLLAHLQTLPAFAQTHSSDESIYGGYLVMGRRIEALRFERVGPSVAAQSNAAQDEETFEVRIMRVPGLLNEEDWAALAWSTRKPFEFVYDVKKKTLKAARFYLPIIGKIEIKA